MQTNRRQFIVASSVALAGAGAVSGTAAAEPSDAPAPDDPDRYDYPVTTEDPETPVATVYGGFDCPYTADMISESFDDILEEFIDPGRLTLRFRALEYDDDGDPYISQDGIICGQAAGGVWQEDPDSFWDFFDAVYDEMPGDMSESKIERIMKDAGVENAEYIADNLENWDPELQETSDDAYDEGVEWTPTIELKGDLGNREDVVEWIEQRLEDDGGQEESGSENSEESEQTERSEETEESSDTEDDSESGEEETSESDGDAEQSDAGGEGSDAESDDGSTGSDDASDEDSSESDSSNSESAESSSSSDGSSDDGSGSTDSSDSSESSGSSDSSDSSDSSGSSGSSGGTGGGGGSFDCGDGHQASDASHGDDSGGSTAQSFVFPEASGSNRFL